MPSNNFKRPSRPIHHRELYVGIICFERVAGWSKRAPHVSQSEKDCGPFFELIREDFPVYLSDV